MKSFARARSIAAVMLAVLLLLSPASALAKKGEKNYKRGLEHEQAQQWEKAAQEFALAVAANPSDTEYQLHYRRAIFNASQVYMMKGRALAEREDYVGAYNAFRQAYGYDPVNELAAQEMQRMLKRQREKEGGGPSQIAPTVLRRGDGPHRATPNGTAANQEPATPPGRSEQLQNINYSGDLEPFIRKLADELNLNVVFDQNFGQSKRTINVRWKEITPARALDYIFMAHGLFFQKLDRRTILVADQSKRPQYQQLVLRTFYLYNIKPTDARTMLSQALPANSGRQPAFIENANTNSITVRDTPENMRIIERFLAGVDKDRSEVVMEVSIYEVSRTDLLQLGNQVGGVGDASTLGNLGGIATGSLRLRSTPPLSIGEALVPLSSGVGLLIPGSSIAALQRKDNTRLIFSTQVHAFDDEKSETRIGSKVPVQTASVFNGVTVNNQTGSGTPGNNPNNALGSGFPVIQYEDTGLVLDFKPKVYPNQDVQVTMNIETKDQQSGANPLTPTFTQRKISGVARIPNGKTMMIASVAQDRQSNGREGLPLVGLIPIIGRLFTAPRRNNVTSDVVITMTPRVLRAPNITDEDEDERPTGSMQTPQSPSLEAMMRETERDEHLARLVIEGRKLPTNQTVQLPAPEAEAVTYLPAPKALAEPANGATPNPANNVTAAAAVEVGLKGGEGSHPPPVNASANPTRPAPALTPAVNTGAAKPEENNGAAKPAESNSGAKASEAAPNPSPTVSAPPAAQPPAKEEAPPAPAKPAESFAELLLVPEQQEMKVGERRRVLVFLKTDAPVGLAAATLRFDPRALAVRSVAHGILTGEKSAAPALTQSVDPSGVLVVSVAPAAGAPPFTGEGLLLVVEVEALAAGETALQFDADKVHLIATDGRAVRPRLASGKFKVTQ